MGMSRNYAKEIGEEENCRKWEQHMQRPEGRKERGKFPGD